MTTKHITTVVLLAGLLAACGGGGGGGDGDGDVASLDPDAEEAQAGNDDADAALMEWVECMRDHGVALEDPVRGEDGSVQIEGPGIHIGQGGAGVGEAPPSESEDDADEEGPDRATLEAADEACGTPPPLVHEEQGEVDEQAMQEQMLAFADCMRDEGVSDFPDPDFSGSGPGGVAEDHEVEDEGQGDGPSPHVVIGPFGEIDLDDPTTAAAFETCEDVLDMPDRPDEPAPTGDAAT
ncbi:MAG: hypothetical protein PV358_09925 [Acidimicrobiales bacterium]|nr:hypothetical protein [Acidimicrobiales bacterium]